MRPLTVVDAIAMPLPLGDLNTDRILPSRFLRKPRSAAYAEYCFHDLRFDADGAAVAGLPFTDPRYRDAEILVAGPGFGEGSSREGAVFALAEYGFRVIIAPSFGEIFAANCLVNGVLTIGLDQGAVTGLLDALAAAPEPRLRVDLEAGTIEGCGRALTFAVDPSARHRLLNGLDDIALSLGYADALDAFERRTRADHPWMAGSGPATQ